MYAQEFRCGVHTEFERIMERDETYLRGFDGLNQMYEQDAIVQQGDASDDSDEVYHIPTVVHLMKHPDPTLNNVDFTEDDVLALMAFVNDGFRNSAGNSFYYTDQDGNELVDVNGDQIPVPGIGVDTKIELCLAVRDPDGNPTTGIITHYDHLQHDNVNASEHVYNWPVEHYYNIFIHDNLCTADPACSCDAANLGDVVTTGVSTFPSTTLSHFDNTRIQLISGSTVYDYAQILLHETGHYFHLLHTFSPSTDDSGNYMVDVTGNFIETPIFNGQYIYYDAPNSLYGSGPFPNGATLPSSNALYNADRLLALAVPAGTPGHYFARKHDNTIITNPIDASGAPIPSGVYSGPDATTESTYKLNSTNINRVPTIGQDCANNDCLIDGDKICDTSPQAVYASSFGAFECSTGASFAVENSIFPGNSCTTDGDAVSPDNPFHNWDGEPIDVRDPSENYMTYAQTCYAGFTRGQKIRMRCAIRNLRCGLISDDNLACCPVGDGCTPSQLVEDCEQMPLESEVTKWEQLVFGVSGMYEVQAGETLIIYSSTVEFFDEESGILVHPGGKLVVTQNSVLKGRSCVSDPRWRGVTVLGAGIGQNPIDPSGEDILSAEEIATIPYYNIEQHDYDHGLVIIKKGSMIRDANVGVDSPDNNTVDGSGGMIVVDGTDEEIQFLNNCKDITVESEMRRRTLVLLKHATFVGKDGANDYRINIKNTGNTKVEECTFLSGTGVEHNGIKALNSPLQAKSNTFSGLETAIKIDSPPIIWYAPVDECACGFYIETMLSTPVSFILEHPIWIQDWNMPEDIFDGMTSLSDMIAVFESAPDLSEEYEHFTWIINRIVSGTSDKTTIISNQFDDIRTGININRGQNCDILDNDFWLRQENSRTVGLRLNAARDMLIQGNEFDIASDVADLLNNQTVGIEAVFSTGLVGLDEVGDINAGFLPTQQPESNRFENLRHGIDCYDGASAVGLDVVGNRFQNVLKGVSMLTNYLPMISHNLFHVPDGGMTNVDHAFGVSMDGTEAFTLESNRFVTDVSSNNNCALLLSNCLTLSSTASQNVIDGAFTEGTRFTGDNQGLKMYCNLYYGSQVDWLLEDGLVMADQGANPSIDFGQPAFRNQWHSPLLGGQHIHNQAGNGQMPFMIFHDSESAPDLTLCTNVLSTDLEDQGLANNAACQIEDYVAGLVTDTGSYDCAALNATVLASQQINKVADAIRFHRSRGDTDCLLDLVEAVESLGIKDFQWIKLGTKLSLGRLNSAEADLQAVQTTTDRDVQQKAIAEVKLAYLRNDQNAGKTAFLTDIEAIEDIHVKSHLRSLQKLLSDTSYERPLSRRKNGGIYPTSPALTISPNPSANIIRYTMPDQEQVEIIKVINFYGELIITEDGDNGHLDISFLPSGIYILAVESTSGKTLSAKFVKH